MKLTINKNQIHDNPATLLRKAGYTYIHDRKSGQESYVRRLAKNYYPRLHCHVFDQGGQITFTLHLDQRPTRYEGQRAHAGEYDSPIVREEIERLQNIINNQTNQESFEKSENKKKWWSFSK